MLLPGRNRVVIELDGKQHYSDKDGKACPDLYAEMMEEDRKLRFSGYEVFRFGGAEFVDTDKAEEAMAIFFRQLLDRYEITLHTSS